MRSLLFAARLLLLLCVSLTAQAQSSTSAYEDAVQKMYIAYYGRPGDPGGIDHWVGKLADSGGELSAIIDSFGSSDEYDGRFGALDNESLVNNIFLQILGRDADAAGLAWYKERLDGNEFTLAGIALRIADGIQDGTDDAITYDYKLAVANAFTEAVAAGEAEYGDGQIDDAVALLADIDSSDNLESLLASVDDLIADLNDSVDPVDEGPVDITNAILVETSGDCALYAALYEASVQDIQRSLAFKAAIEIVDNGTTCTLTSNSVPNHDFNDETAHFATAMSEISQSFSVTRLPELADETTDLSQRYFNAIMLNGVPLDLISAGCYKPNDPMADPDGNVPIGCMLGLDDWIQDPLGTESGFGTDIHNAHTQPNGLYHYHGDPGALFDGNPGPNGSPVIGFAADGFPVYGNYFYDGSQVRQATSGFTLKAGSRPTQSNTSPGGAYDGTYIDDWEFTDAGDLDACNGMTIDGQYGYYVTSSYPWVMACLSGSQDSSFGK